MCMPLLHHVAHDRRSDQIGAVESVKAASDIVESSRHVSLSVF